ncbi:MAG: PEP-CTERM sorting domain-containing protein [Vicinamibacteria bacterium]
MVFFMGIASISGAATIVVVTEDLGTTQNIVGITGFSTLGSDMAGMSVAAFFSDGSAVTATWEAGPGGSGFASAFDAATDLGFSLTLTGDTFTSPWALLNTSANSEVGLTALFIDGFPGDTVFDRTFNDLEGTPFSALGADFNTGFTLPFIDFTVTALYSDQVAISGFAPVGDLFRFFTLDLGIPGGLLNTDGEFIYTADTDSIGLPPQVAEPGSLLLLGAGLAGLWYRRRR